MSGPSWRWVSRKGWLSGSSESSPIPGRFWPDLPGRGGPGGLPGGSGPWRRVPTWARFWLSSLHCSEGTVKVNPGSGGGGRRKLSSVHGRLDDFGLEFLVSKSNKDSLRVLRRGGPPGGSPEASPSGSAPASPPSSVSVFLGSPAAPGATLWLVVFGFGCILDSFCLSVLLSQLSPSAEL